jgi:5-methylcytosine-specific restriction endonuclease McrA
MPNRNQFNSNEEYNAWYQNYRNKNRDKARAYNREYNKQYRKVHGYFWEEQRKARFKNVVGSYRPKEWLALKELYAFTCYMCVRMEPFIRLTVDHKIPISKGGTNYIDNIQPLCGPCNNKKMVAIWFASCPLDWCG